MTNEQTFSSLPGRNSSGKIRSALNMRFTIVLYNFLILRMSGAEFASQTGIPLETHFPFYETLLDKC